MPTEVSEGESTQAPTLPPPATDADVIPPAPAADEPPGGDVLQCANCLTPLAGPYCWHCGQHVADYHRSVWRFIGEFFENTFCWDNKLLRTLDPLFKRPGWLTQEFMAGRRVRYVHPLRLFLFTSAICLALLQFNHGYNRARVNVGKGTKPGVSVNMDSDDDDDDDNPKKPATPSPPIVHVSPVPVTSPAAAGSPAPSPTVSASVSPTPGGGNGKGPSILGQVLREAMAPRSSGKNGDDAKREEEVAKRLEDAGNNLEKKAAAIKPLAANNVQQKASWVALAMLPIFAWLMRFTYGRRGGFFFSYLVFSLHYHTFLLLFWTAFTWIMLAVDAIHLSWLGFPLLTGFLVPPWYLYLSLKRFYGESRLRTAVKTFAIGGLHLLAIVIGTAIAGVGANLTIK